MPRHLHPSLPWASSGSLGPGGSAEMEEPAPGQPQHWLPRRTGCFLGPTASSRDSRSHPTPFRPSIGSHDVGALKWLTSGSEGANAMLVNDLLVRQVPPPGGPTPSSHIQRSHRAAPTGPHDRLELRWPRPTCTGGSGENRHSLATKPWRQSLSPPVRATSPPTGLPSPFPSHRAPPMGSHSTPVLHTLQPWLHHGPVDDGQI